jgi:hypothetical protein
VADRWADTAAAGPAAVVQMDTVGWRVAVQLARIAELQVARTAAAQVDRMEAHTADQVARAAVGIEADHMRKGCRTVAFPAAPWDMAFAVSVRVEA